MAEAMTTDAEWLKMCDEELTIDPALRASHWKAIARELRRRIEGGVEESFYKATRDTFSNDEHGPGSENVSDTIPMATGASVPAQDQGKPEQLSGGAMHHDQGITAIPPEPVRVTEEELVPLILGAWIEWKTADIRLEAFPVRLAHLIIQRFSSRIAGGG